ncbi:MAG TPA: gamma-glutamylcyclotransferase family protein [Chitinophagaceae bacterium]|nr:gamma-glutamylcyclotransferase family protein [Chitinophagaceae bacterium]
MEEKIYYLFVYGSLRRGFHSEAYQYISNYFHFVGDAKVKGLLYDLGPYPAAVPVGDDRFIVGELYEIKNKNEYGWALAQLDDYEGLNPIEGDIPFYKREAVEVFINDHIIRAWVYWFNQPVEGYPLITSGDVLEYFRQKINKE